MTAVSTPARPAFASISQLGHWLRNGETTPTKLVEYFLDRLVRLGGQYHAVVNVTADRALEEGERAARDLAAGKDRGPLHGIPYGIKDLFAARGAPTTWGAAPYRDRVLDYDATVVTRLAEAGALLCAKLATVEIAGGMGYQQADASFTGPGINPWNRSAWSGGSSTGPGIAVAAGLVPFAVGTETWGSIVTPASYCGVSALRPTYGRVSRHGAMPLAWTMDKVGPFARSADDLGTVLDAMSGPDPKDPTTLPAAAARDAAPRNLPLRFAVPKNGGEEMQAEVQANFEASLKLLGELGTIQNVELPQLPLDAAADIIVSAEMSSSMEDLIGTDAAEHLQAPEDRIGGIANGMIFAKDYLRALRLRGKGMRAYDAWFADIDVVVAPSMPAVACPLDVPFREYFSRYRGTPLGGAGNLLGLPALSIPNGIGERGLPTGLLLVGPALSEETLLHVARELQKRTNWHRQYPPT